MECQTCFLVKIGQKAQGPWLAHLSEIAAVDMQLLCNIFLVLSMQLMKGSSSEQFLVLNEKNVFFYYKYFIFLLFFIYWHDRRIDIKCGDNCQRISADRLFNNVMIIYV